VANRIFGHEIQIGHCSRTALPENNEQSIQLGRHLDGCRIGFDLGGSDRKAAAVADGNVVFTEEIPWNPYFEKNPQYHINGIRNTIERAATHLPRVDAIGGSAAGVYVDNRVHVASLFRGIAEDDFDQHIKNIFPALQKEWDVPFAVVNDGEVAALAGSMAMNDSSVLGISMGTSLAAGYVTTQGNITSWLNELAFAPIDYSDTAPIDEWSGRRGCGVQYFSQQAVARLAPRAGIELPREMPMAEQLLKVQTLMLSGDNRATAIFETIGVYLGYALAHYADFYDFRNVLLLGRVTSGPGGELIVTTARTVLKDEFPDLYNTIQMHMPGEREKRHGQAVAAASLPALSTMEATIS
jgi:predicted NBD/HSP70 family sugar kinase